MRLFRYKRNRDADLTRREKFWSFTVKLVAVIVSVILIVTIGLGVKSAVEMTTLGESSFLIRRDSRLSAPPPPFAAPDTARPSGSP